MLRLAARRLAPTRSSIPRASRAYASIALDKSHTKAEISDLTPLEPAEFFPEFADPSIRSQLSKLREIENELISKLTVKTEPVDWAYWEKNIEYPGLVAELKKIHESLPMPDVEAEKERTQKVLEDLFNPIIAEFAQLAKDSEAEALALEKEASEMAYLRDNVGNLGVDEFLEKYPSVKASIEDDIANNRWFVSE